MIPKHPFIFMVLKFKKIITVYLFAINFAWVIFAFKQKQTESNYSTKNLKWFELNMMAKLKNVCFKSFYEFHMWRNFLLNCLHKRDKIMQLLKQ